MFACKSIVKPIINNINNVLTSSSCFIKLYEIMPNVLHVLTNIDKFMPKWLVLFCDLLQEWE